MIAQVIIPLIFVAIAMWITYDMGIKTERFKWHDKIMNILEKDMEEEVKALENRENLSPAEQFEQMQKLLMNKGELSMAAKVLGHKLPPIPMMPFPKDLQEPKNQSEVGFTNKKD